MCELSSGLSGLNCDSMGGVSAIYIGSLRDETTGAANYTYSRTAGRITAMANVGAKLFYEIKVDSEMSDFTVNAIGTRENASAGFEITGNIKLHLNYAEADQNIELLENLVKDRVCVIVKLNEGYSEVLGIDNGVKFLFNRASGTKFDDFNGVTLTFSGRESKNTPVIANTIVTSLIS